MTHERFRSWPEVSPVRGTIEPLSRGDALKISTLPQAIVAAAGILAVAAVVVSLALAGWSPEASKSDSTRNGASLGRIDVTVLTASERTPPV